MLSIDDNLTYYINETPLTREELPAKLKAIGEANPEAPAFLRAGGKVPYAEVAHAMAAAKAAGMPRVGLVFDPMPPAEEETP